MSEHLKVLLIEDCPADAELLLHALKEQHYSPASRRVQTESELKNALDTEPWDVVLADFSLPQFSAMAALMIVRERDLDLPFVVVSGEVGEATAVEAMRAGAHDFVSKDNLDRLGDVVRREVEGAQERRRWRQTADKVPVGDSVAVAPSRWEWFGPLALATSLTLVVTVGVELLQEYFFPSLTTWTASLLVVVIAGPVAAVSIYYLLARRRALMQRMLEEFMEHRRLNEMRRRLGERTRELEANIRERQRRERHLQAQHAITRVMAGSRPLPDALQALLHSICEHLAWDHAQFWSMDTKTSRLRRTSVHSMRNPAPDPSSSTPSPWPDCERLCERVWGGGKPVWLPELRDEEPQIASLARTESGQRSALAFPIRLGHEVLGVMAFLSSEPKPVDRELLQLLDDIGNQIGQFMERLRAESALQKAHEELESRVRRRTAELASLNEALTRNEAILRQAQQIARLGSFELHTPSSSSSSSQNYWSEEARRILGSDPQRSPLSLEQFLQEWILPEDRQRVLHALTSPGESDHRFEVECRATRPDLETRFLRILGECRHDPTTSTSKLVGTIQDITERKQLERQVLEISENEQRRIGQDLHDDLCQHLAGIEFMSQALHHRLEEHPQAQTDAELAQRVAQLVRDAINQTRGLARGLSPVQLESRGLRAALEDLAEQVQRMFHVRCHLTADPDLEVRNVTVATHLYRIAQEAITNAVRHGKADQIEIELHSEHELASLRVGDNGLGFQMSPHMDSQGMGLRIMHYRAGMIGASLVVRPREQRGTLVECTFSVAV